MNIKKAFNNFLQIIYRLISGLLVVVAIIFIIVIGVSIGFNLEYNPSLIILSGITAFIILYYAWKNREKISESNNKNTSGRLFLEILRLCIGTVFFCVTLLNIGRLDLKQSNKSTKSEAVVLYTDSSDVFFRKYYLSNRSWTDFNRKQHQLPFKVNYDDVLKSYQNKEDFQITNRFTWNIFYKDLADNDRTLLEGLSQTFFNYQKENKMNRRDFAELMITAIQDIPYTLILPDACESKDIQPCIGDIKMGLFAPAEFVSNLTGDCDTRTVLLFTLLSRFNYNVAILNSEEYRHSVLGLNIPSTGKFKKYQNKKYYFVETTARGCPIGYLSPDVSNINFWNFELIHN